MHIDRIDFTVRRTVRDDWQQFRALRLEMLADTPMGFGETLATAEARQEPEWRLRTARGGEENVRFAAIAAGSASAPRPSDPAAGAATSSGASFAASFGASPDSLSGSSDPSHSRASVPGTSEGEWIGTMGGYIDKEVGGPVLYGVYVTARYRGDAFGVTDALLAAVEGWAIAHAPTIWLDVHADNLRAQAAYAKRGFVTTGKILPYELNPGELELEMIKRLR